MRFEWLHTPCFCWFSLLAISAMLLATTGCGPTSGKIQRPSLRLEGKIVDPMGAPLPGRNIQVGLNQGYKPKTILRKIRAGEEALKDAEKLISDENGAFSWSKPADEVRFSGFMMLWLCLSLPLTEERSIRYFSVVSPDGQGFVYQINITAKNAYIERGEKYKRLPKGTVLTVKRSEKEYLVDCTLVLKVDKTNP
jgi:hypothetical protein